jgi:hypothetical protein
MGGARRESGSAPAEGVKEYEPRIDADQRGLTQEFYRRSSVFIGGQ